ncbi:MAG: sodium/solute symporter [Planctomycetes bacterium]|nr:sodium/solute symporter [Planctomycetota bacterium]
MFHVLDWVVLGAYLAIVVALGMHFRRRAARRLEFFLAARSMPVWAVAISVLATSQSAATFIGGPEQSYAGDLTYLSANLGGLIAVIVVAVFFLPAFYRRNVVSIYELLGQDFGLGAQRAASAMFMLGRVFASGARLFIVAIPFSLIAFGSTAPMYLLASIAVITVAATAYTLLGGIRAVIWTDVLQAVVYIGATCAAVWLLWQKIPLGPAELIETLRATGDGHKLTIIDASFDRSFTRPYNLWAVILGLTLLNTAAYGTDQDLTQRMLTCRSAARGSWSLILSYVIGWPVIALFMLAGLLLYVYYQRPDLMGDAASTAVAADASDVFVRFILHEMPVGMRGLMMAGLFAAAMSSLDSALNAMASTTVSDFYRTSRARRGHGDPTPGRQVRVSRAAVVLWAIPLAGFASLCVFWQRHSDERLIDFALGVMVFAYSGLLAVFLAALFTRRGNSLSAIAALATGFVTVLALHSTDFAFGWKMLGATVLSFAVCCIGRRH